MEDGGAVQPPLLRRKRMLSREYDGRCEALFREGFRNRLEFDRFRPGPNDQPDVRRKQPSP